MSENGLPNDVYARVPRWMWGVLVAAIAWATHVTIQLSALNIRVEQTANVSDQVGANVKIVTELLITNREHDRQISRLNEKSEQQLERLHRLELQQDQRLQNHCSGKWTARVCMARDACSSTRLVAVRECRPFLMSWTDGPVSRSQRGILFAHVISAVADHCAVADCSLTENHPVLPRRTEAVRW